MVDWKTKLGVADSAGYQALDAAPNASPGTSPVPSPRHSLGSSKDASRILDMQRVIQSGIKYYHSRYAEPDHHPKGSEADGPDPFIEQFLMYLGDIIDTKVQDAVSRMNGDHSTAKIDFSSGSRTNAFSSMAMLNTPGQAVSHSDKQNAHAMLPNSNTNAPVKRLGLPADVDDDDDDDDEDDGDKRKSTRFTDSKFFQFITLAVIAANTVVIALEAHFIADQQKQAFFRFLEFWFCVAYLVELALRLREWGFHEFFYGHGCYWNWFDFVVTALGTLTILMSTVFHSEASGTSVIRLFRMLRMLRIFRAFKFIKDIEEVITHAFKATMKLFFIAFIVVFIFGIMFCNLLWDTGDPTVAASFGNLELSMWSMFRLMTMDNWVKLIEPTLKFNPNYLVLFIIYIFLASIALMSLVPAIFVEQSMTARERAKEARERQEAIDQQKHDERMLHELFRLADVDGSGKTSLEELKKVISDHSAINQLKKGGFTNEGDISDVTLGLFDMLEHLVEEHDHTAIQTTEKQFIEGVFKQRDDDTKAASWRATTAIRMQVYRFTHKLRKDMDKIDSKIESLRDMVQAYLTGAPMPSPKTSPRGSPRESSREAWTVWEPAAGGSRGPDEDVCFGNPKNSPRETCGSRLFG